MRVILFLFIIMSSTAFAEQDTSALLNAGGSLGSSIATQAAAQHEYKQALIAQEEELNKNGIKPALCKQCEGQNWDSVNGNTNIGDCANPKDGWFSADEVKYGIECNDPTLNNTNDNNCTASKCATGCQSYENFNACGKDTKCKVTKIYGGVKGAISTKIDGNVAMCETYLKLKKSSGLGWAIAGDLLNLATQVGGALLSPGCKSYCGDYSGKEQTRCLCQHTGKDGKPCMEPTSNACKNADTETCEEQMTSLGLKKDSAEYKSLKDSCDCGLRNSVDPRGGWVLNDKGACVNNGNNNNNNNNVTNDAFEAGYEKTSLAGISDTNNNNATAAAAANGNTSGASSKLAAAGLGSRGLSAGNNDNKKDKGKTDLSAETGHGAGRASNAMTNANDAAVGSGSGQDFKVKKGEKAKDVAKADGEDIFKLVSAVYKSQVDANALDSTRPMKKIERKIKQKGKKA